MGGGAGTVTLALTLIFPAVSLLCWRLLGPDSPFQPSLHTPAVSWSSREERVLTPGPAENLTLDVDREEEDQRVAAWEQVFKELDPLPTDGWRPRPLLCARRLGASGFAAKMHVGYVHPSPQPGIWMWSEKAEEALWALYNTTQYNDRCNASQIYYWIKQTWGITSRMRDTQDMMFFGITTGKTMIYGNAVNQSCPKKKQNDPYMYCFFKNFSSCYPQPYINCQGVTAKRCNTVHDWQWLDAKMDGLWDHLRRNGLYQQRNWSFPLPPRSVCRSNRPMCKTNGKLYECRADLGVVRRTKQIRLAVMRSMLVKIAFRPSNELAEYMALMRKLMGDIATPMLVVHCRRTDKRFDMSRDRMMPQELNGTHSVTLEILVKLVSAAERLSGISFKSIYFFSDNARIMANKSALLALSQAGKLHPPVLTTPFNVSRLLNGKFYQRGHGMLDPGPRHQLNYYLMAELYWAAENGMYLVGNARSGVSQLLAQLLGAKFRMDPNWLALWEDDQTMLSCLEETRDIPWIIENPNITWTFLPNSTAI